MLSIVIALGAVTAYVLLLRVAAVRNHPEGHVVAFALATAMAALAVAPRAGAALACLARARAREPPAGGRRLVQFHRRAGAGHPDGA